MALGDRVMGSTLFGAFAEQMRACPSLQPVPAARPLAAAASGVAHRTAYHALRHGWGPPGESWCSARPAAWAWPRWSSARAGGHGGRRIQARRCAALCGPGSRGGDRYTTEDLKARVKEITGGGADVVIDPVGGANAELALRALRWGGRFVTVGFASGEIPRIPLNLVLLKGVRVTGFTMGGISAATGRDGAGQGRTGRLLAAGRVTPHISARYPWTAVGPARSGRATGDRQGAGGARWLTASQQVVSASSTVALRRAGSGEFSC